VARRRVSRAETRDRADARDRADTLKRLAIEEGFEGAAVCPPEASGHIGFLRRWLSEGFHGSMGYLSRPDAVARRADVRRVMPGVRSVLVVTHGYDQEDPEGVPADRSRGVVARYARGRDYHRVTKKALLRVHRRLEEVEGTEIAARAYVDTGPILERDLARRAGLGWFGKNTMLIHPRHGSFFFLGVLLLGIDVEPDSPETRDLCGSCRACLDACPTGALLGRDASGAPVMDATRCISYLTIEHRGAIPRELRPAIGNRIFGCDICQEVCPFNTRFSEATREPAYAARVVAPPLVELMATALDDGAWDAFTRGSAVRRSGRAGLARNVAVALGNWGAAEAVPALSAALSDPEPLVRGHAAWALGRIRTDEAGAALEGRAPVENDPWVSEEIALAIIGLTRPPEQEPGRA
jgi:epoxyqueuosine reductase